MLLQAFYSVRSERQLMERLDTDLLFRWFVGLGIDDAVWDATVFSKNHETVCSKARSPRSSFRALCLRSRASRRCCRATICWVDGTLVEAWASMKSFKRKDGAGDEPPPRFQGTGYAIPYLTGPPASASVRACPCASFARVCARRRRGRPHRRADARSAQQFETVSSAARLRRHVEQIAEARSDRQNRPNVDQRVGAAVADERARSTIPNRRGGQSLLRTGLKAR